MNLTPWEQQEREPEREAQGREPREPREQGQAQEGQPQEPEQEREPGQAREPAWQGWRSYGESWSVS